MKKVKYGFFSQKAKDAFGSAVYINKNSGREIEITGITDDRNKGYWWDDKIYCGEVSKYIRLAHKGRDFETAYRSERWSKYSNGVITPLFGNRYRTKKYYWKVVRKSDDNTHSDPPMVYVSACIRGFTYKCYYTTEIWTESKVYGNGIFVFKTRKDARWFRNYYCHITGIVFKVEVDGEEIPNPIVYDACDLGEGKLVIASNEMLPPGTTTFEKVRLVYRS